MRSLRKDRSSGFTWLEVAGYVSLLLVGFVALTGVYVSVSRQSEQTVEQNRVSSAIRYVVDEVDGQAAVGMDLGLPDDSKNAATYTVTTFSWKKFSG